MLRFRESDSTKSDSSDLRVRGPATRHGHALIVLALLLVYALMPWNWHWSKLPLIVLVLVALYELIRLRQVGEQVNRPIVFFLFAYLATSVVSVLANGAPESGIEKLGNVYLIAALALPLFPFLRRNRIGKVEFYLIVAIAALCCGVLAVLDVIVSGQPRAGENLPFTLFGYLSVSFTALVLGGTDYFLKNRYLIAVLVAAVLAGSVATVLSGTRGAWLALMLIMFIYMALKFNLHRSSFAAAKNALVGGTMAVLAVAAMYYGDVVVERTGFAIDEVSAYFSAESAVDIEQLGSVGARFELWKAASILIWQNPVFGVGVDQFEGSVTKLVDLGRIHPGAGGYEHAHNQILHTLATQGLLGFVALLGLYLAPAIHFWRRLKSGSGACAPAVSGLLFLVASAAYGLTAVTFDRRVTLMLFILTIPLLYSLVRTEKPGTGDAAPAQQ